MGNRVPGLHVPRVIDGPLEEVPDDGEGVLGPDVGDGVVALWRKKADKMFLFSSI